MFCSSLWIMTSCKGPLRDGHKGDKQQCFPLERCLYNLKQLILLKWVSYNGAVWHGPSIKARQSITRSPVTLPGRPATPAHAWFLEPVWGKASPGKLFLLALKEGIQSYSYSMFLLLMKMSTENYLLSWRKAYLFWQIKIWQCVHLSTSENLVWQIFLVSIGIFSKYLSLKQIIGPFFGPDIFLKYMPQFSNPHFNMFLHLQFIFE